MIEEGSGLNVYRLIYLMKIPLGFVFFFLEISTCYGSAEASDDLILRFTEEPARKQGEIGGRSDIDTAFGNWINYRLTDPLTIEISYAGLEKDERRLRENHRGESFVDGLNYQLEVRSWLDLGKFLSFTINPKLIGWRDDSHNHDFTFKEAYGRLSLYNIELEVGRDSLWWGPGYHGALLVSNNAFPFDMIRLGTADPFQLPWIFERLGYFKITSFITRLEEDRDFSRTKLFGFRVELTPVSFLELGLSRVTMFDGEGRPGLSFTDFLRLYFSNPNRSGKFDVNELASVDFKLRIPGVDYLLPLSNSIELYGEIGGEDEAGFRPIKNGYIFGIYLPAFLKNDGTDLRVEYANNHVSGFPDVWYNHSIYTSGYTFRGNIMGHHMGSDSDDIFIRVTRNIADRIKIGLQYDMERHGLSNPVIEKKREAELDINIYFSRHISYLVGYEYEMIENLDLSGNPLRRNPVPGEDVTNHYVWTSMSFFF